MMINHAVFNGTFLAHPKHNTTETKTTNLKNDYIMLFSQANVIQQCFSLLIVQWVFLLWIFSNFIPFWCWIKIRSPWVLGSKVKDTGWSFGHRNQQIPRRLWVSRSKAGRILAWGSCSLTVLPWVEFRLVA